MNPWRGQLAKEWRMNRSMIFWSWGIQAGLLGMAGIIAWKIQSPAVYVFVSLTFLVAQLFYLALFSWLSLRKEQKLFHLWLQTPLSARHLLLAKLIVGLYGLIGSLVLIAGSAYSVIICASSVIQDLQMPNGQIGLLFILGSFFIIFNSLSTGVFLQLVWAFYMATVKTIGKISGGVLFVCFFFISPFFMAKWEDSTLFQYLFSWGDISWTKGATITENYELIRIFTDFNIGNIVYYGAITVMFFLLAAMLVDRKVEV
ncbi:hypothetical protein A374_05356 [Fictibacillus macauensis ZFHKF-1]|uniref:Uncharacterized protein n=1 Tax=Fictibacillus macauensis ZFHKF-1 TaxID=1196324 RepID=I8UHI1_9BACL|nr:hypothetical protein [Fictibacillus macauensis]EIT86365.1 hypothetical protein A374_05356 [Fictibacillus macauensis ZFHKF-1]